MTKKLRLKEAEPVTPFQVIAEIAERTEAGAKLQKTLAEAAYQPPAQQDAFRQVIPIDAAGRKLLQEIEKIERLEEDKQAIMADQAEILAEMKAEGYDMAAVRDLIRLRKMDDPETRLAMLKNYVERLGMTCWPG